MGTQVSYNEKKCTQENLIYRFEKKKINRQT